jgi:uncharacterized protein
MTTAEVKEVIAKLQDEADPQSIALSGSEPLLCFDLIQQVVGNIRELQQETGRPITLSITSTGTLLTRSMPGFFDEAGIDLCVSIDGPAPVYNLNRKFKNGRGSFAHAVAGLKLAQQPSHRKGGSA